MDAAAALDAVAVAAVLVVCLQACSLSQAFCQWLLLLAAVVRVRLLTRMAATVAILLSAESVLRLVAVVVLMTKRYPV
jgi:hypothetical protein